MTGPAGRALDVELSGPADGLPLIFHTGSPSAGSMFPPMTAQGTERGVRHISYARPGYAGSDRDAGRTVADCTADVAAIADELAVERFLTVGWSGGGPHALACAALLPDRTIAAATLAGVGPTDAPDLDFLDGMGEENVQEFRATRNEQELLEFLRAARVGMIGSSASDLRAALGDLVTDADRRVLGGDFAPWLSEEFGAGLADDVWGWLDDDLAFSQGWGFDVGAISVPVSIWQGAQDRFVPIGHGRWLADHVAGARAHLPEEHGHLSLGIGCYGELLDELLESAGGQAPR